MERTLNGQPLATPRRSHVVQVLNPEDTRAMIEAVVTKPVYGAEHIRAIAHALDEHSRSAAESDPGQRPTWRSKRRVGSDGGNDHRRGARFSGAALLSKLMPGRRRHRASVDREQPEPARAAREVDPVAGDGTGQS